MNPLFVASINELQIALCRQLMQSGSEVDPRGSRTREVLGFSFEIENPRNRLTTLPVRRWSPALAVAELAWHIRGDDDVLPLAFYAPRWREFADADGLVRGSCYGARIFKSLDGKSSQWANVRRLLTQDPFSRRAVLNFRMDEDVSRDTNDVSCTNVLQFIIRENRLHAFVSMRSNDAIWGVPYDVFFFTSFQELMALELGVDLGSYRHYAASMHVYERHFDLADQIALSKCTESGEMPPMEAPAHVYALAREEEHLRVSGIRSGAAIGGYGEFCLEMLLTHKSLAIAA